MGHFDNGIPYVTICQRRQIEQSLVIVRNFFKMRYLIALGRNFRIKNLFINSSSMLYFEYSLPIITIKILDAKSTYIQDSRGMILDFQEKESFLFINVACFTIINKNLGRRGYIRHRF